MMLSYLPRTGKYLEIIFVELYVVQLKSLKFSLGTQKNYNSALIHQTFTLVTSFPLPACQANNDEQWSRAMDYVGSVSELNYLSQIVIMLYEDPTKDLSSDNR